MFGNSVRSSCETYLAHARRVGLLALASTLVAGCGGGTGGQGAEDQVYLIKFPHVTAPSTPKGQAADRFKELAEARFPGRVVVEVYPSSQLMNDDDSLEALAFGEIQMIAVSLSKFDRLTHSYQVFDLPFLFPNLEAVEAFQASPAGRETLTELTDRGFLGLAFWHNGMKQLSGPRPLRVPADAAGLKFRIQESDVLQAQFLAIGGSPQKMDLGEVYQALQTGAVDAQENTWSNIFSSKFFEVQPYITESNHGYIGYLVAVNPQFWNSLPDDIRTGLDEIVAEVTEWGNARSEEINQRDKANIIASGRSEIIQLTPEELTLWQEAMRPVWDQFSGDIGNDLIDAAIASRPQHAMTH